MLDIAKDEIPEDKTKALIQKRVKGTIPKKRDVAEWSEGKVLSFLKFFEHFTKDGKYNVNMETIAAAEARQEDEEHWDEFMWRIDRKANMGNVRSFYYRLMTFARIVLGYLKENPHMLSLDMLAIMQGNERMEWASKNFKVVQTDVGQEIVVMDTVDTTIPANARKVNIATPLQQYEQAKMNMLSLMQELAKTIPARELKQMSVKDRIAAFNNLLNTAHKVMSRGTPNTVVFKQLNINRASRGELEQAVTAYSQTNFDDES